MAWVAGLREGLGFWGLGIHKGSFEGIYKGSIRDIGFRGLGVRVQRGLGL